VTVKYYVVSHTQSYFMKVTFLSWYILFYVLSYQPVENLSYYCRLVICNNSSSRWWII